MAKSTIEEFQHYLFNADGVYVDYNLYLTFFTELYEGNYLFIFEDDNGSNSVIITESNIRKFDNSNFVIINDIEKNSVQFVKFSEFEID